MLQQCAFTIIMMIPIGGDRAEARASLTSDAWPPPSLVARASAQPRSCRAHGYCTGAATQPVQLHQLDSGVVLSLCATVERWRLGPCSDRMCTVYEATIFPDTFSR